VIQYWQFGSSGGTTPRRLFSMTTDGSVVVVTGRVDDVTDGFVVVGTDAGTVVVTALTA
jgi:hydroxyethylthiazole kinase-like sugar kinase family protein